MSGRDLVVSIKEHRKKRVQFMKTPRSSAQSSIQREIIITPPDLTPALLWRRASSVVGIDINQNKVNKIKKWKKMTDKIEKRRLVEQQIDNLNYSEAHLPVLNKGAVRRSTLKILERKRINSAATENNQEPYQPDDVRSRPSTQLKNRMKDYRLPVSYNNFIVNQLEIRWQRL